MSNRAWVTLATNDSYGLGALVLAHSLRRAGSVYPAVILITPSVTDAMRERLSAVFAEVITVNVLDSRDAAHLALLQRPELGITFTKIHCWSLTQFEKCVFLDADTLVIQNCDELFEREELSAAPDVGWPDCFNSGVFVYQPSQQTFDALIRFAQERGSFDGGDQGLLNSYFSNWAHGDISKHLPFLYNVTSAAFYSYLPALKHFGQNLKIIHFIGAAKPWLQTYNWESHSVDAPGHLQETLQLWWDIFVASVHPKLDESMVEEESHPELPPPDLSQYYEPEINPHSEFPWHHVDEQQPHVEENQAKLDLTNFFDPWDLYRGNIPPKEDLNTSNNGQNHGRVEVTQELREYAWEYKAPQQLVPETSHSHDSQHYQHSHEDDRQWLEQQYDHRHQPHAEHQHHHDHQVHHNYQPLNEHKEHHFEHHYSHQYNKQNENESRHSIHIEERSWKNESQVNSHNHSVHNHKPHPTHTHLEQPPIVQQAYHFQTELDVEKPKTNKKKRINRIDLYCSLNGMTNGYISGEDCDEFVDDIRPRHPYDGFYLRHKPTIDPMGRRMCRHQLPPTPPPTPPLPPVSESEEDESFEDALEVQSGVAGNLARVVPGAAGTQRDAIDELTRRQGWEAGHIDYMGADSFDNIWAKISQTLSQAPKQPSPPPKEPTPPPKEPTPPPKQPTPPPKQPTPPPKQPTPPPKQPTPPPKQPSLPKEQPAPAKQPSPPKEKPATPAVKTVPVSAPVPAEPKKVESVETKSEIISEPPVVPPTPPVTPKSTPEPASTPVTEVAPTLGAPKEAAQAELAAAVAAPKTVQEAPVAKAPSTPPAKTVATLEKNLDLSGASSDSPPLANTPAKEVPSPAPKTEGERGRKPAGKLQLNPPAVADPLPTPDSELEDAASLAQSIIASELATPTVTSATPPALMTPTSTPPALKPQKSLSIDEPIPDTPPAGPVSLAQIGVKPGIKAKPSTAAQIESSVSDKSASPESPLTSSTPSEPGTQTEPKKKAKKVVKKDAAATSGDVPAPVPPPRKKEKKPKEK